MAITISGENNNDRILASDGVIDEISGINIVGVITATTFVGNLTGNVTGNLTGNVNSTSPLLLQTDGGERFRITGNNELGIAGANYGSSGQVLTSGGSGSAVSWTTPATQTTINSNTNNYLITGTGTANTLQGESGLTWTGSVFQLTSSGGNQFPFNIRNDFTPNSQRCDYGYFANATSNNALRLGSINSNGGVTIQSTRMNDSSIKHRLIFQPDGGDFIVGATTATNGSIAEFSKSVAGGAGGCHITVENTSTNSVNNTAGIHLKTDQGVAKFFTYRAAQTYIQSRSGGASELLLQASGAHPMRLYTNGNERLRIESSGNVTVKSSANNQQPKLRVESYGEYGEIKADGNGSIIIDADPDFNSSNSYIGFSVDGSIMSTINSDGNLAINKTSGISAKLHIGDDSNNGALSQLIKLGNDSSGAGTGAQINMGAAHGNESTAACIAGFLDSAGGTSFIVKTAGTYANQRTVAERFRINSSGNIGAGGITSPLWTSGGGIHLNDNYGIGFGNGGSGRPDFQLMVTDGSKLEFRCGFGADTADIVMDTSGRLLIGTTSQSISSSELFEVKSSGQGFSHFRNNSSSYATIYIDNEYSDTGFAPLLTFTDGGGNRGGIGQDNTDLLRITGQGGVSFYTNGTHGSGTENFRVTSHGRVRIKCEDMDNDPWTTNRGVMIGDSSTGSTFSNGSATGMANNIIFANGNGLVGKISTNGSTTTYHTSSDYRVKENAVSISDGIARLKTLKPYKFNFKADPSTTLDGFFAHEVSSAVPEAVDGEKDELYTEDYLGYKVGDQKLQTLDSSKLIPLLTAALQEAITKIETLEARVAALEGS